MSRQRGIQRERDLKKRMEAEGYWVARAAGSLGDADLIAMRRGGIPMMIEVKSTAGGPYEHFGPADRQAIIEAADRAGAVAWLVWWPPRRDPKWINAIDWPQNGMSKKAA